jgi:hypothetical protein
LQERKKKIEQNLGFRKRTTETTPQGTIQELQKRASKRQIKRQKIESRRGAEDEERKDGVQRQRCRSFMQSLVQAVFVFRSCPIAHLPEVPSTAGNLATYLPEGNNERVCNT